jgi:hypothetical protein
VINRDTTLPAAGQWSISAELPGGLEGTVDEKFNPHGFDRSGTILVTADYVQPSSTWADPGKPDSTYAK